MIARSMAAGGWAAWPREDLAPRRAWMAEQMREKVRRHLSHQSVVQYGWSHFYSGNILISAMKSELCNFRITK